MSDHDQKAMDALNQHAIERRADLVRGLRELADLIEANPELPTPSHASATSWFYGRTAAEKLSHVAKHLPGVVQREASYGDVIVFCRLSGGVEINYQAPIKDVVGASPKPPVPQFAPPETKP